MNRLNLSWLTLSRVRLVVQVFMLWLTVWGASVVGHYAADKISGELPALSCAYDKLDAAYCILIPLQHQLHHRIGEALVHAQQVTIKLFLPLLFTVLAFYVFFFFLNKAFCGWICPLGTVQELLYKLGRMLRRPWQRVGEVRVVKLRMAKWILLLGFVLLLPLLAGMGVTPRATGDAYCQVCPSRLATTLLTGNLEQVSISTRGWLEFGFGAVANTLFGFVIVAALALRQPFCRICPMMALHATFQRLSPMRLVKNAGERCQKCGICHKACPMEIHEIWRESGRKAFHEDCTLCGRCAEFCPDYDVISLKFGPLAWFRSGREYYKRRVKTESPHGEWKTIKLLPRRDKS